MKGKNSSLESKLKSKDAIIENLTMQLLSSDLNNLLMKSSECNLHETLNDKPVYHNKYECSGNGNIIIIFEQKSRYRWKFNAEGTTFSKRFIQEKGTTFSKRFIQEKDLSKNHCVIMDNFRVVPVKPFLRILMTL